MSDRPFARIWRFGIVLLVVLALASGAGAPLPLASAQPPDATVSFLLSIAPRQELLKPLCVGQSLRFYIAVERAVTWVRNDRPHAIADVVSGVKTIAAVTDPAIGTIKPLLGSVDDGYTGVTSAFDFTAKKSGHTTVKFSADVSSYWLGNGQVTTVAGPPVHVEGTVALTVKKCRAKVSGFHRWSGEHYLVTATLDETELTADDQGTFTGTGTVTWVAQAYAEGCITTDTFAPSQVNLTGHMTEAGDLVVHLEFDPAEDYVTLYCAQGNIVSADSSWTTTNTPGALALSVPASGGVVRVPQTLAGNESTVGGDALLVIVPEEDQAVAARPNATAAGWHPAFHRPASALLLLADWLRR